MDRDRFPTLVELLRWRSGAHPDRVAYRFLADGERETHRFTYAELDRRARAVAARLQHDGARGQRVLITYPAEEAHHYMVSFLGCLYAGAVAVPCDAPRGLASVERLESLRGDARPALTCGPKDFDVAQVPDDLSDEWQHPALEAESLALLQYTSGSTRQPRGVMVSHSNIMANEKAIAAACRHDEESSFVGWLPLFHDMGMIANSLQPLYLGSTSVLMPPAAFLSRPVRWLEAISRYRGVTGGGPNFAYDLCVARVGEAERQGLDLSSWRVAFNGAEMVREATIRRFTAMFGPHGFAPETFFACYGLAEATLIVAGAPRGAHPRVLRADPDALRRNEIQMAPAGPTGQPLVSSGRPVPGTVVSIRDPETAESLPDALVGEIYVEGPGVARGYWQDSDATAHTFPARHTLRTGDLGALVDGELVVVGRRKDLIVVRGQNHHPADLEWTVERSHPALRPSCGAVVAVDDGDTERIVVIQEAVNDVDVEGAAAAIRQSVAQRHGLHVDTVVFAAKGSVPKTTSGKIRRAACRDAWLGARLPVLGVSVQARPVLAQTILELIAERAGAAEVLDSLTAVQLQHELQVRYGLRLSPFALLGDSAAVARMIEEQLASVLREDEPAQPDHDGPIGATARALWFEHELAPPGPAYVLTRALRIRGPLDREALRRALAQIVRRHPALRTSFVWRDGEPAQVVGPGDPDLLVVSDLDDLEAEMRRPLSPASGEAARFTLLCRSDHDHVLVLAAHHAVADFWSLVVVIRELQLLYQGAQPGEPKGTPLSHARREAAMLGSREGERLWEYWRARLEGAPAFLELPTDRPRPAARGFRGASHPVSVGPQITARLRDLAKEHRCTLFTIVLAAYQVFLSRLCGQRDLVVGVLASGRDDAAIADAVGCFVNTIPVRGQVASKESFARTIERVRADVLRDLAHSSYPLPEIVRRLGPSRAAGRSALVQAMLVYQQEQGVRDEGLRALALGIAGQLRSESLELDLESVPVRQQWTHLDLTLNLAEIGGSLTGSLEYDTALFAPETAAAFAKRFAHLIELLSGRPDRPIEVHPLVTPDERSAAIATASGARVDVAPVSLHGLVTPARDCVSVTLPLADGTGEHLSGRALRRWVGALVAELGVGHEERVGILLDRCLGLPAAMLAVLECGAAYVPIDPADPPARIAELLADADIRVVLTSASNIYLVPTGVRTIDVDAHRLGRAAAPRAVHPEQAAYVIYTSGSTGPPKGVVVSHRGIVNRLMWMQETLRLESSDRVLHKAPTTFDVSVWELFCPLIEGATLVIGPPGMHSDPQGLAQVMRREQVTVAHMVPSLLAPLRGEIGSLRHLVCSGEALTPQASAQARETLGGATVWNLYGPTEASIDVTSWRCTDMDRAEVPIGRPISNVEVHVLGPGFEPQPDRVKGELFLGGTGLARGYLGRPGRTAASFLPHPLSPEPGARMYRSGDIGLRRGDGAIVFIGRTDHQIKLAGNRIELGEIEEALLGAPGVTAAAAALHDDGGGPRLVGYVVGEAVDHDAVRRHLRAILPTAHIPAQLQVLAQLPTARSGKLDRRRLPAPRAGQVPVATPARTPAQRRVAGCWAAVLGVGDVGIDDDFFGIGGDSILALRAVAALREAGVVTTVGELVGGATVRTLAAASLSPGQSEVGESASVPAFAMCPADVRPRLADDVEDAYPVSLAQRAVLFHQLQDERHETYVTTLHIRARFDATAMRASIAALLARHAYLRSTFDLITHREPMQLIHSTVRVGLTVIDGHSDDHLREERKHPFDVAAGPLIRFRVNRRGENEFQLLVASFALDGWCTATVLTELLTDYSARLSGHQAALTAPSCGYSAFVALERAAIESRASQDFWAQELSDATPCKLPRAPRRDHSAEATLTRRITVPISADTAGSLSHTAKALGVPLKGVLLAAHLRVVRLLTGRQDVVTGLEVNGRPEAADGDRVVGVFNNIVPLRTRVTGTWADLVRAADQAQRRLMPHRRYPLARLDARDLFDTLFVYTHFHLYQELSHLDNLEVVAGDAPDRTYVPLTAHFNTDAATGALRLMVDYDPIDVDDAQARVWADCYEHALQSLARGPDRSCLNDPLLPAGHVRRLLAAGTGTPAAAPVPVHALIAGQAARTPDAVAVVAGEVHLTYRGLMRRSAVLANALRANGAGVDTLVAIPGRRNADLVVGLLAILRSGGAYLPIDPGSPSGRVRAMLAGAGVPLLLAHVGDAGLAPDGCRIVSPRAAAGDVALPPVTHPAALAYALPTSGSTGRPKLVGVPHAAVSNYLRWCLERYRPGSGRNPVHSPVEFDLTVTSLLAPLCAGGAVELLPTGAEPEELGDLLATGAGGSLKITPSHFAALGTQMNISGRRPAVSCVILGGEALRQHHLAPWAGLLDARIINEYGPTEATVGCTVHIVQPDAREDPVPIGRPITGASAHVLDEGHLAPDGVVAELAIGGMGLARGYLGNPGATAERFVPDPFGDGGRAFRSGDRVHRDPDGVLHYVGRSDRQVKVRGHRIEPAEIEHELCLHPLVRNAAVVGDGNRLTGYWVGDAQGQELDAWLRDRLPPYMIPDLLVRIPMLPLNSRGKVDYAALPDPRGGRRETLIALAAQISDDAARELFRAGRRE